MLAVCGVNCCTDCHSYLTECAGCNELQGKIPWAVYYNKERCPIYECVIAKGLQSCGDCGLAPCKIWYDTRNPDISDIEFEGDIQSRLNNLKHRNEGTKC